MPEQATAEQTLAAFLQAAGPDAGIRCNVAGAPLAMLRRAGARFLSFEAALLETFVEEDLGQAIEEGAGFLLGLVPALPDDKAHPADEAGLTAPARRVWGRLGLGEGHWDAVVVTPATDVTLLDAHDTVAVLRRCRAVARSLQAPAGDTHGEELDEELDEELSEER